MLCKDKTTYVTSWGSKGARKVAVMLRAGEVQSSVYLTIDDALRFIKEIEEAIKEIPAEATAADLGLEAA